MLLLLLHAPRAALTLTPPPPPPPLPQQLPLNASLLQERNQTEQQLYSQLDVMCQVLEDIGSLQDAMNNTMDAADPTSVLAVEAVGRQLQSDIYNWVRTPSSLPPTPLTELLVCCRLLQRWRDCCWRRAASLGTWLLCVCRSRSTS